MANPFTRWQRFVSRFLPWFDPDEEIRKMKRTEELVEEAGHSRIRVAYTAVGNRAFIDRRKAPR